MLTLTNSLRVFLIRHPIQRRVRGISKVKSHFGFVKRVKVVSTPSHKGTFKEEIDRFSFIFLSTEVFVLIKDEKRFASASPKTRFPPQLRRHNVIKTPYSARKIKYRGANKRVEFLSQNYLVLLSA